MLSLQPQPHKDSCQVPAQNDGIPQVHCSRRGTGEHGWHRYQHTLWYSILFSIASHFDFHEWVPVRALKFIMFTTDTCPNEHLNSPYFLEVTYSYATTNMQFSAQLCNKIQVKWFSHWSQHTPHCLTPDIHKPYCRDELHQDSLQLRKASNFR